MRFVCFYKHFFLWVNGVVLIVLVLQEQISALEKLLDGVEERVGQLVEKPATRVQACQLLATTKQLRREVEAGELPDLEAEYTDEEVRNNLGLGPTSRLTAGRPAGRGPGQV